MFKTLKELFQLLSSDQRKRFYRLQVLVVLMLAIASAVSIITTWRLSMFSFSVGTDSR